MLVIKVGIHKMIVRIANREDSEKTSSSEAVWSGSALFFKVFFSRQMQFEISEHLLLKPIHIV